LEPSVPTDDRRSSTKLVVGCKAPLPLEHAYQHVLEVPIFLGWKIIQNKENVSENQNNVGGNLLFFKSIESAGSPIQYNKIESKTVIQHKHSHYTESSLIQKLEELGIGRPSTFSMLVETIQDRGYVKKMDVVGEEIECIDFVVENQVLTLQKINKVFGNEKNKLVIQPIGILTTEFLVSSFSTLFDYEYTKHMEDALDLISNNEGFVEPPASGAKQNENRETPWSEICIKCNNEIKQLAKTMNSVEKKTYKINDEYILVFMKNGPVLIKTLENGTTEFANVVKDIQLNLDKLSRNEYTIDDLLEMKQIILGKHEDNDVLLKNGKYGPYIEYHDNAVIMRTSVKHIQKPFHLIEFGDVLPLIVKNGDDARAPPNAPNKAIIRIIDDNTSIRKGKFGAYVYYKTEHMKSPQFFNMSKFKKGYAVCDLQDIKDWLKDTHNI
jgi:DNA topoisomerase-1